MNKLIENNKIAEIKYGTNFAFVLNDDSMFIPTEYKVLRGQGSSGFLRCLKMYYNGKIQLFYLTGTNISLQAMLPRLNENSFISVIADLFGKIIDVKNNGFLSCVNIDTSFDRIFVDPSTLKVSLVYLPITEHIFNDYSSFENELRVNLIKLISITQNILDSSTKELTEKLQNGSVSIEDLFHTFGSGSQRVSKDTDSDYKNVRSSSKSASGSHYQLKLVTIVNQARFEIAINKAEFTIGKKASAVDGVISFNKTISRVHCKITKKDNNYYITDLRSANGTYLNGIRLSPDAPTLLNDGDIVRLSNTNFQVVY